MLLLREEELIFMVSEKVKTALATFKTPYFRGFTEEVRNEWASYLIENAGNNVMLITFD